MGSSFWHLLQKLNPLQTNNNKNDVVMRKTQAHNPIDGPIETTKKENTSTLQCKEVELLTLSTVETFLQKNVFNQLSVFVKVKGTFSHLKQLYLM